MSSQRALLALTLLASVSVVLSASSSKRNDVIIGSRIPYDHLVHSERIEQTSSWFWGQKIEKTFNTDNGGNITQVKVLDQKGNGATASIRAGGPGSPYVTVLFRSDRNHGIHFIVELFGR